MQAGRGDPSRPCRVLPRTCAGQLVRETKGYHPTCTPLYSSGPSPALVGLSIAERGRSTWVA
eukprot:16113257-Heterocapsa_arctica.AAC.1